MYMYTYISFRYFNNFISMVLEININLYILSIDYTFLISQREPDISF